MARLDARTLGALIALFERAVGLYASLVDVNAYHQPGVEAGKKAAGGAPGAAGQGGGGARRRAARRRPPLAAAAGAPDEIEAVLHLCEHLAANGRARAEGAGAAARFARA